MSQTKYQAADEFYAGLKKALFRDPSPPGFKWESQSPIFMNGYECGRGLRDTISEQLNQTLERHGFNRMETIVSATSQTRFQHRGIGFTRTGQGYWFFDAPPPCCNAWERYGTDEEVSSISNTSLSQDEVLAIIKRMIDRMLSGQIVYREDLRYRFS